MQNRSRNVLQRPGSRTGHFRERWGRLRGHPGSLKSGPDCRGPGNPKRGRCRNLPGSGPWNVPARPLTEAGKCPGKTLDRAGENRGRRASQQDPGYRFHISLPANLSALARKTWELLNAKVKSASAQIPKQQKNTKHNYSAGEPHMIFVLHIWSVLLSSEVAFLRMVWCGVLWCNS